MNLFVDTNIYLDFYHFSKDDLEELKKLVDVIKKGEINLIVTSQVVEEIKRNRDSKIADAYKQFVDSKLELKIPEMCKSYSEFSIIKTALRTIDTARTKLQEELDNSIRDHSLQADTLIQQLLDKATSIDTTKYLGLARERYDFGTPPGKNDSYGDALNWIGLLKKLNGKEDLCFISDDKDFKSPFNINEMSSYLVNEWERNKGSKIFFYTKLSDFFKNHHQDIQLKIEEEKNKWIEELETSPNFKYTHHVITQLSNYVSFTDEQLNKLASIAVQNSQVNSILDDEDVKEFYQNILKDKYDRIDKDIADLITEAWMDDED